MMRPLTIPSSATATVMGAFATACPPVWPGASHQETTVTAERMSHAYVVVLAGRLSAFTAAVTRSPHHVQQAEDDYPQQVDHVPVGGPGFDHGHASLARVTQVARDDSQDEQTETDVEQVHAGQHVIEHEELVAGHGVAGGDLGRP